MEPVMPAHIGLRCAIPTYKTSLLAHSRAIEINLRQHFGETKMPHSFSQRTASC
jgi:hypothetical protein